MKKYVHFLARPIAPYRIITFTVGILSGLGLIMVLSSSAVKSFEQTGSSYSIFLKQTLFFAIAIGALNIASRMKMEIWQKLGKVAIPISIIALLLPQAPVIGKEINGNRSWINLGPFTLQPAEFAKLVLILFIASRLVHFENRIEHDQQDKKTPEEIETVEDPPLNEVDLSVATDTPPTKRFSPAVNSIPFKAV